MVAAVTKNPKGKELAMMTNVMGELVMASQSIEELCMLVKEAGTRAVMDTACSKSCAGMRWYHNFKSKLPKEIVKGIVVESSDKVYQFGGGETRRSRGRVKLPVVLGDKKVTVTAELVEADIPLLIGANSMETADAVIDFGRNTATFFDEEVPMEKVATGHFCINLLAESIENHINDEEDRDDAIEQTLLAAEDLSVGDLRRLHHLYGHTSAEKLTKFLAKTGKISVEMKKTLENVAKNCEACVKTKRRSPRPKSSIPRVDGVNQIITVDLKEYDTKDSKHRYICYLIDMHSRLTIGQFIPDKKPSRIVETLVNKWIPFYGIMGGIHSDIGGEMSNEIMEDVASNLGIKLTTAAYSPHQNGLNERNHAIVDLMLKRMKESDPEIPIEIALSWSLQAKNSLENSFGFSPFQLHVGYNPILPTVTKGQPPAMEGRTKSEILGKHLTAMHRAREEFIKAESSSALRKVLKSKIFPRGEEVSEGDWIYYLKDDGKAKGTESKMWKGPSKVVAINGKKLFIDQGARLGTVNRDFAVVVGDEYWKVSSDVEAVRDATDNIHDGNDNSTNRTAKKPNNENKKPESSDEESDTDQSSSSEDDESSVNNSGRESSADDSDREDSQTTRSKKPNNETKKTESSEEEADTEQSSSVEDDDSSENNSELESSAYDSDNKDSQTTRTNGGANDETDVDSEEVESVEEEDVGNEANQEDAATITRNEGSSRSQNSYPISFNEIRQKDTVKYKLQDSDWEVATVQKRGGKQTGKYRNWWNVKDKDTGEEKCINTEECEAIERIVSDESASQDKIEETLVVVIPRHLHNEEECIRAKERELLNWENFEVFEEVPDEGQRTLNTNWVLTKKMVGNKEGIKARLCVRGDTEENVDEIRRDSPTVNKINIKLFYLIAAQKSWTIKMSDVKAAFLQGAALDRDVYLKPPKEMRVPGVIWKMLKRAYGFVDASRGFYLELEKTLETCGCVVSKHDPAVFLFYKEDNNKKELKGMLLSHVDDFLHGSGSTLFENQVLKPMRDKFKIGEEESSEFMYVGTRVIQSKSDIVVNLDSYTEELQIPNIEDELAELRNDEVVTEDLQDSFRSLAGKLGWLSKNARPDLSYDSLVMSTRVGKVTAGEMRQALKILKKARVETTEMKFPNLGEIKNWILVGHGDAGYRSLPDRVSSCGGYVTMIVNKKIGKLSVVSWKSKKVKRVVSSSTAAEVLALNDTLDELVYVKEVLIETLGDEASTIPIELYTDSRNLYRAVMSTSLNENPRLRTDVAKIQESLKTGETSRIILVTSHQMLADCLTKKGASSEQLKRILRKGKYEG